jgi:hypothetical protein
MGAYLLAISNSSTECSTLLLAMKLSPTRLP